MRRGAYTSGVHSNHIGHAPPQGRWQCEWESEYEHVMVALGCLFASCLLLTAQLTLSWQRASEVFTAGRLTHMPRNFACHKPQPRTGNPSTTSTASRPSEVSIYRQQSKCLCAVSVQQPRAAPNNHRAMVFSFGTVTPPNSIWSGGAPMMVPAAGGNSFLLPGAAAGALSAIKDTSAPDQGCELWQAVPVYACHALPSACTGPYALQLT